MSKTEASGTVEALEAAKRWDAKAWLWWVYDRESDRLVLQAMSSVIKPEDIRKGLIGLWDRWWAAGDRAFLVLRSPRYVRMEPVLVSPELATGTVLESVRSSLPPRFCAADLNIVVSSSEAARCAVVCESAGFFEANWRLCIHPTGVGCVKPPTAARDPGEQPHPGNPSAHTPLSQSRYFGQIEEQHSSGGDLGSATVIWFSRLRASTANRCPFCSPLRPTSIAPRRCIK